MKKFIEIFEVLVFTLILSITAYCSDNWKSDYKSVEENPDSKTYVCTKTVDRGLNEDISPYRYYLTDKNGNVIFESEDEITPTDDPDRYILYTYNYREAYITNAKGEQIGERYRSISKLKGKNAYIVDKTEDEYNNCGIIDDAGNEIVPCKYSLIREEEKFGDGLYEVFQWKYSDDLCGIMDENLNFLLPVEYNEIIKIGEKSFYAIKYKGENQFDWYKVENGQINFYKTTNWRCAYDEFVDKNPIMIYREDSGIVGYRYGIADINLNIIVEPKYDDIDIGDYSIVQYGSTDSISDKGFRTQYNGKFGIIDDKGNEILKCEYDKIIRGVHGGFICIKDNKKYIYGFDTEITEPNCSDWARDSIISGNFYGIVPEEINSDFKKNITRKEFCRLVTDTFMTLTAINMEFYEKALADPFKDTDDKYVLLAYHLSIVKGKEKDKFCPDEIITRQEAAVMLANFVKLIGYTDLSAKKVNFIDEQYFADWAKESIYKMVNFKDKNGISVMSETMDGKFSPWYGYSREQAITNMVRIYDNYRNIFTNTYQWLKNKESKSSEESENSESQEKTRTPIEGLDGAYIVPDDSGFYVNIVNEKGEKLINTNFREVDTKLSPGNMLVVYYPEGIQNKSGGVLSTDFRIIVPRNGYGKPIFWESNGKIYIEVQSTIGGGNPEYYDTDGNIVNKPNDLKAAENNPYDNSNDNNKKPSETQCNIDNSYSKWAEESIKKAISLGIVPENIQSKYTDKITRGEFCRLAVQAYMSKMGNKVDTEAESPFIDVDNAYITSAYKLKIVAGVGNNKFAPNNDITRQEAAVMLNNLASATGVNNNTPKKEKFIDEDHFAVWAKKEIYSVAGIKSGDTYVMVGTEPQKFSPWMNYTREQAIATVYRLYNCETSGNIGENLKYTLNVDKKTVTISGGGALNYNPENMPYNEENIENIIIENGVTSINHSAFYGHKTLKSIVISDSVKYIGAQSFVKCKSLENVTISNSVATIENYMFAGCTSLKSIVIPDRVTTLSHYIFNGCTALESITVPESVTVIDDMTFSGINPTATIYCVKGSAADNANLYPEGCKISYIS